MRFRGPATLPAKHSVVLRLHRSKTRNGACRTIRRLDRRSHRGRRRSTLFGVLVMAYPLPVVFLLEKCRKGPEHHASNSGRQSIPVIPIRSAISRPLRPSTRAIMSASRQRAGRSSSATCNLRSSSRASRVRSGPGASVAISNSSRLAIASIGITCSLRTRSIMRLRAMVNRNGLTGSGRCSLAAS